MKTRNLFMAALATLAFVGCTSDEFVGENSPNALQNANGVITFGFDLQNATRADQVGATAADALGNQFIVWGEKNEAADGSAAAATNQVFPNYQVNYIASSANKTESNSADWEYVGYTHSTEYQASITGARTDAQTIKYWDYSATGYTFTAVSAKQADITAGNVQIAKTTSSAALADQVYKKGYTLTLNASADATKLFVADRQPIAPTAGTDRTADNTYGGNVTLRFRNILSHIRVAMYETVPGYTVTIKKYYYDNTAAPAFGDMATEYTTNFAANVPNQATGTAATITVTYNNAGSGAENTPVLDVSGTKANYLTMAGTGLGAGTTLATSVTSPTYNNGVNYTAVFPQEANATNLKLKLDYTLTSPSGEVIEVTGATAEVPAEYLRWKPNYKYTYIFKISDNTNGSTGQGVVGLYPITFDAVVVVAEDGLAEYISTVSEPSITTFGVKAGKYSTGKADYETGTDIYATIMEGSTVQTPVIGTNVNIYTVTTTDEATAPLTEDNVAFAIANPGGKITPAAYSTNVSAVATVPTENGSTVAVNAVKMENPAVGVYVIEYTKAAVAAVYTAVPNETTLSAGNKYYTSNTGEGEFTAVGSEVSNGSNYFTLTTPASPAVKAYKIVKVVTATP